MRRMMLLVVATVGTAAAFACTRSRSHSPRGGSTARPLANTVTSATNRLDGALDARGWSSGANVLVGSLDAVSRTDDDGALAGALDRRPLKGCMLTLR